MSQVRTDRPDLDPQPSPRPAGFARRLAAAMADIAVMSTLTLALGGFTLALRFPLEVLAGLAYYVGMEGSRRGQTLGKRLLGIRVLGVDGRPIGRGRALLRHVGGYVSALALGIGYLWMLWDERQQTWHDKMARAVVVVDVTVTG